MTLNVSAFSHPYTELLARRVPEFEDATGAKVNFDRPSFPVYNQRPDLVMRANGYALGEIDYRGGVSVEVFDYSPGIERLARESIDNMRGTLAQLAAQGSN